MKSRTIILISAVCLILSTGLLSCGSRPEDKSSGNCNDTTTDVSGTWVGTRTSSSTGDDSGNMKVTISQIGTDVTGTLNILSQCYTPYESAVSGIVNGSDLTLEAAGSTTTLQISFSGTVDNGQIAGSYSEKGESCEDAGTFLLNVSSSNCFEVLETSGCDDQTCQDTVCAIDSTCCDDAWDATCLFEAIFLCIS